jgi:hypothetical protein
MLPPSVNFSWIRRDAQTGLFPRKNQHLFGVCSGLARVSFGPWSEYSEAVPNKVRTRPEQGPNENRPKSVAG